MVQYLCFTYTPFSTVSLVFSEVEARVNERRRVRAVEVTFHILSRELS